MRVRAAPDITLRAIIRDSQLVGSIASFVIDGKTEVAYWIDRSSWGQGVASRALTLFLQMLECRPVYARAASDNAGSLKVLRKACFQPIGTEFSYAAGRSTQIEETILRLG